LADRVDAAGPSLETNDVPEGRRIVMKLRSDARLRNDLVAIQERDTTLQMFQATNWARSTLIPSWQNPPCQSR
jgi:hypothetical protein